MTEVPITSNHYEFGFHDKVQSVAEFGHNQLDESVVCQISHEKQEPEWMLNFRLSALKTYKEKKHPTWGPDISVIDFNDLTYYRKKTKTKARTWEDVPDQIKETFKRLGVPQAEQKVLAGVVAQYESEAVYHNIKNLYGDQGVVFTDCDTGLKEYPDLFKKYFGKLVPPTDSFQAALNSAVWSGGTFIYVPEGVHVKIPLQTYFRMNDKKTGQFERTLIIVDKGAYCEYIEGCTAPTYAESSLHGAVVEIFVEEGAYFSYSTIQNWSDNVFNLVTERARVEKNGTMEWLDGNLGSQITMKYPATYLVGEGAKGTMTSIALAKANQKQDTGAKMIHLAPHTSSRIISKSIVREDGRCDYRGDVRFGRNSQYSKSHVECDTILMDPESKSDTFPMNEIKNAHVELEHEAKVSKISEEQLYYLMSKGLSEKEATEMIIMGFVQPVSKQLPLEYAVELNRLIVFDMAGSVG